ncbi:MAG: ATP-grasp domain-containing protein [Clostridiales Family XIII bacterium]|nr:ATP-grasp domain-containing protein [Clostridiales Family XIII bacterium]
MIKKVFAANRGEIVNRIMRTCRLMGIETVVAYSDADADANYVTEADAAFHIGASLPMKSYLNIEVIIAAIRESGADAVHPGYGFLSEQAAFARAVEAIGAVWIGPSADVLEKIESKSYCRRIVSDAGVPVVPGSEGLVETAEEVLEIGRLYGYPIMLKLDGGGGGKGIEAIDEPRPVEEIKKTLKSLSHLGEMAFGSGEVYAEKRITPSKHVEVQFVADRLGNIICLGERECSIQRRYQKIVEEAPSIAVTLEDRRKLYENTAKIANAIGYCGAGTVEYLKDANGNYYFMEINARLQVEHPVSEMVTGVDIVEWQLLVAAGQALPLGQDEVKLRGHALEVRVYAEDPVTLLPCPGVITKLKFPHDADGAIRIEHAIREGSKVTPYYDPMICKVIVSGNDRTACIATAKQALGDFQIEGIRTNLESSIAILEDGRFESGDFSTDFIQSL